MVIQDKLVRKVSSYKRDDRGSILIQMDVVSRIYHTFIKFI